MKVAFFSTLDSAPWGGCEVLWYNSAIYFARNGLEVTCYVPKWPKDPEHIRLLREYNISVVFYRQIFVGLKNKIIEMLKCKIGFHSHHFKKLLDSKPDYIFFSQSHSYDLGYFKNSEIRLLIQSGIPYSVICQNNSDYNFVPPNSVRDKIREVFKNAQHILFVSKRNLQSAELHLCLNFNNARIISNSLSIAREEIAVLPYASTFDMFRFATVANLKCSHKGQNLLLHVFSQKKWKKRSWQFHLYGTGEDEIYLKELVVFLGLSDRVFFHGHVNQITDVWTNNHLLLLASFGEGLPLALQEAMILGRAAVVSDVGGNSEMIEDGVTGFLANGTTFSSLDAVLDRAWKQRFDWQSMGFKAHQQAMLKVDIHAEHTLYELTKIISRNG
jgi:glycosyltransferase involved in cell wall biosynthesis